jgi:hypothetical protein
VPPLFLKNFPFGHTDFRMAAKIANWVIHIKCSFKPQTFNTRVKINFIIFGPTPKIFRDFSENLGFNCHNHNSTILKPGLADPRILTIWRILLPQSCGKIRWNKYHFVRRTILPGKSYRKWSSNWSYLKIKETFLLYATVTVILIVGECGS